jgi:hypothetical protein
VNAVVERVDMNQIVEELPIENIVDRVDVNEIVERVDIRGSSIASTWPRSRRSHGRDRSAVHHP